MARIASLMNVPSDSPTDRYRTPNENPQFDTEGVDISYGQQGTPVNSPGTIGVTTGATGQPVSNGG